MATRVAVETLPPFLMAGTRYLASRMLMTLFLNEPFTPRIGIAAALIVAAVVLITRAPTRKRAPTRPKPDEGAGKACTPRREIA